MTCQFRQVLCPPGLFVLSGRASVGKSHWGVWLSHPAVAKMQLCPLRMKLSTPSSQRPQPHFIYRTCNNNCYLSPKL